MDLVGPLSEALSGNDWISAPAVLAWGFASIWMSRRHLAGVPLVVGYLAAAPDPDAGQGGGAAAW
jgi:hypothetical protein